MFARVDFAKLELKDALDLATLIEHEAFERYAMFAEQLGHRHPEDAGSVFHSMANNERKHGEQLAERRKALFGDAPATVKADDLFDVEAPEVGAPRRNMSVLKAFEVALSSEKKAYAFYNEALAHITQKDVKALFEELRDEETEHVAMVEAAIAKLPPSAAEDIENEDDED